MGDINRHRKDPSISMINHSQNSEDKNNNKGDISINSYESDIPNSIPNKKQKKKTFYMNQNITIELKMFYQRLKDLNKLKNKNNKEKNKEKELKINDIIIDMKNKMYLSNYYLGAKNCFTQNQI